MKLINEKEESKKKIILAVITIFITLLGAISLIMVAGFVEMPDGWRVALIVIAFVVIFGGIFVVAELDRNAGAYECKKCGERFVPAVGAYIGAIHTITRRHLKCPKCGKRSWCIRRLSIDPDEE